MIIWFDIIILSTGVDTVFFLIFFWKLAKEEYLLIVCEVEFKLFIDGVGVTLDGVLVGGSCNTGT